MSGGPNDVPPDDGGASMGQSPQDSNAPIDDLIAAFHAEQAATKSAAIYFTKQSTGATDKQLNNHRLWLALPVVGGFVVSILVNLWFAFHFTGVFAEGRQAIPLADGTLGPALTSEALTAQLDTMRELLASVFLPVVTLVIGYYFGTENRSATPQSEP